MDGRISYRDARTYLKRRNWIRTYRIKRRRRRKGSVGGASISGIVRAPKAHDHLKWRGKGLFQELTGYSKNSVTRTVLLFFVGLNYCFIQTRCINNDWKCHFCHLRCLFLDAPSHLYKRVCPSVRPWVRPSVRTSVRPLALRKNAD